MNKATLKENRKHGDPVYPVSTYDIHVASDEPLLDLHWHDELELLLVTEGQAVFRVDVHDYEVKAGEAIFVNSGELHSGYVAGSSACSFEAVVFHAELLGGGAIDIVHDQYIQPLMRKNYTVPVHITGQTGEGRDILGMLNSLFAVNRSKSPVYELTTKGLLCLILSKLLLLGVPGDLGKKARTGSYRIDRLKKVIQYIEQHYPEPILLKELAGQVSMSEAYFCRFFKNITTKSPVSYINDYRVQQAALLLRQTDKKVMEVALDVGFNNLSYFNTMFKQRFGCTPVTYRKREQDTEPL
ncbi:AraC family transcriptional regulator [Paenibacillus sambharensis]|uniref:AraC family transcriptional regulator n=1 Tax=Paenibacillus sambharensis TaxID=1803190 RepID=A0A2W1LBI7_9BACL|nr:AraC family transcriptional regulator [Paenibacillus sambharensis]PZD96273.1 AraC family transcriptional regulator [Paenibacillus sambharensis]